MNVNENKASIPSWLRRAGAIILASLTAAMTILSGGVATAFAAETSSEDAKTVTLANSESATLAFVDADGRSKSVKSGTDVKISISAKDEAEAKAVAIMDADGNMTTEEAVNGVATVKVEKDVTVMPAGNFAVNAEALKTVEVSSKKAQSLKDYIKENANSKYVGKVSGDMGMADAFNVTTTVVDGTKLANATLAKLNEDANGDDIADNAAALSNQTVVYTALYKVGDGDYYVGRVNTDFDGAKVTDIGVARNNAKAEMVDDVIYDKATGLVYVPKSYSKDTRLALRMQLIVTTDAAVKDAKATTRITANNDGVKGALVDDGSAMGNLQMVQTDIKLSEVDNKEAVISADKIDSVDINGINYTAKNGAWAYDEKNGVLTIGVGPYALTDVKVNMSDTFTKSVKKFFKRIVNTVIPGAHAAETWIKGSIEFPSSPKSGTNFVLDSKNVYQRGGISGYLTPMSSHHHRVVVGNIEEDIANQTMGKSRTNLSDLDASTMSIERAVQIPAQTKNGVNFPSMKLNLMCSHITVSVGGDNGGKPGPGEWRSGKANVRIMAVNGDSLIIGVTIPTVSTQAGAGFFKASWKVAGGYLSVKKVSSDTSITRNNKCYKMAGARYGVYKDEDATDLVGTLTVKGDGTTGEVFLPEGNYWIKERSGDASGYGVNPKVRKVHVEGGEHKRVTLDGNMAEPVLNDPIAVLVQKSVEGEGNAGVAPGDVAELGGIKFRVDYYDGYYTSADEAEASGKPKASAVFVTEDDGYLDFADAKPVDGTSWKYRANGQNTSPLGTLVITEVGSHKGLITMGKGSVIQIVDKHGTATAVAQQKWPKAKASKGVGAYENKPIRGGITVTKADADTHKSEPQGDATLEGVKYQIVNKSLAHVVVNGKMFEKGEVVWTGVTKYDASTKTYKVATGKILPYGTYEVTEAEPSEGYLNAKWSQSFTIRNEGENHEYRSQSTKWNENKPIRGGITVTKADADTHSSEPQGDATLEGVKYQIVNKSKTYVIVNGKKFDKGDVVWTGVAKYDDSTKTYKVATGSILPYGTYEVTEIESSTGYLNAKWSQSFTIRKDGENREYKSQATKWNENEPMRGGIVVTKADADTHSSEPQGDATLDGVKYQIVNKSLSHVVVNGKTFKKGEVVWTGVTKYDSSTKTYKVATGKILPYGTYDVIEVEPSEGYLNAKWSQSFTIRKDGETHEYKSQATNWNENKPIRGGITVTKADADTHSSEPQGDATLEGVKYQIVNKSKTYVIVNGTKFAKGDVVWTGVAKYDDSTKTYKVATGSILPYGTYEVTEIEPSMGYLNAKWRQSFTIRKDGENREYKSQDAKWNENEPMRGGIVVTKADSETHRSEPQGDATLEGVKYQIVNKSLSHVVVNGTRFAKGDVVWTGVTKYDTSTKTYKVATGNILPYGTYEVTEIEPSEGYLNAKWSQSFTIRSDGETHEYKSQATKWNENKPVRGGVAISKVDRETRQYTSLGEAHLDGAMFDIVNKSKRNVLVGGKEYKPGQVVKTIASRLVDGRYIAQTGERDLPYGTYEIHETGSGKGYLYDSVSKNESYTFQIRKDGKIVDMTQPKNAIGAADGQIVFDNQVQREDWNFKKKDEDSMERMAKVAFLVTSNTTGESHIIVTDENGTWGSAWNEHTNNTNANDPDSPITNGAVIKDGDGNYVVKDASKLDSEAGTWFTGMPAEMTKWAKNGKSYDVNGKNVLVNDAFRSFPYDTYTVKELASSTNTGHKLVTFTVTLHKFGKADGEGIDIDYGTIDDKVINIKTELNYGKNGKVVPAAKDTKISDVVSYDNVSDGKYTLKGELHLVNADGKDEGVVAKAEKAFEVKGGNSTGTKTVDFTIDTSSMGGKKLVAFEYLMQNGTKVAKHEDIEDEGQTVMVPKIGTTLTGDIEHEADASSKTITLTDTVNYENLEAGKTYTMSGKLMDKSTGKALVDKDGKEITASTQFAAKDSKGSVTVIFEFTGVDVAGKSVVAFESVKEGDVEFAVHADIEDKNQIVHFPDVKTEAIDKTTSYHEAFAGKKQTIVDTVKVRNLTVGNKYKLNGVLHVQSVGDKGKISDGGVLKNGDKEVVAEKEFTADKADMTVTLEFTLDASDLAGKTVTAFETLSRDGKQLGLHDDITDAAQSVHFPDVKTEATDKVDGGHEAFAGKKQTIVDTVKVRNLIVGHKYKLNGAMHVQNVDKDGNISDGGVLKDGDKEVVAEKEFTADKADMTVTLEFTFDASKLGGKTVTAFETLSRDGKQLGLHADITDVAQSVHFPDVKTEATDKATGYHEAFAGKEQTIVDTVTVRNLIVGNKYKLNGALHVQNVDEKGNISDGGVLKDGDKEVVVEKEFVADKADMTVTIEFKFDASKLAGKTVTAFETLSRNGKRLGLHTDIADKSQTVHFPDVKTEATDKANGGHEAFAGEKQTIVDTVKVHNLIVGNKYKLNGAMHVQNVDKEGKISDGGVLKNGDKEVVAEKEFTAKKADMTVTLEFTFDASDIAGKTVTAFETLSRDGKQLGLHADITDVSQSVSFPKIGTDLTDANGSHDVSITKPVAKPNSKADADKKSTDSDAKSDKSVESDKKDDTSDTKAESDKKAEDKSADKDDKAKEGKDKEADKDAKDKDADKDNKADKAESKITSSVVDGTKVVLIDHVGYENLIPGTEYTINGKLHLKNVGKDGKITDGGVLKDASGKKVTGTTTFKPEKANGTVEVKFEFDAANLAGKSVVAFEDVMKGKQLVATHSDISDENQTVRIVEIGTTAIDAENKTHTLTDSMGETQKVSVVDTVAYMNLKVGQAYTVEGKLHMQKVDKDGKITDGGVVKDKDGKEVTAKESFTPEKPDGTVEVTFEFEVAAGTLDGTTLVAFEDVKNGNNIIATHADITDDAQSVRKLKVGTTLTGADKKAKDVQVGDKIDLIDTIAFENLVVGQEYVVKGKLVDASGAALKDKNGKEIVAESKFKPNKVTGTAEMKFIVDTSAMKDGDKIVAYEYVYTTDGKLVGHHMDLKDANQTVVVKKDSKTPKKHVDLETGVDSFGHIVAIAMGILALAAVATYVYRRRKGQANV